MKKINWPMWLGFLISVFALLSYPFVFVNWPATRDFPWANIALFLVAALSLVFGMRRAFAPGHRRLSKIAASVITAFCVLALAMFIFAFFIAGRWLPLSSGAPQVNQKAPDFTLKDTNEKQVSLGELLSQPLDGRLPKGVLLVFYRGYW
jgi:predicted PurR-regulated permease PerM